jgi:hypothetical protein
LLLLWLLPNLHGCWLDKHACKLLLQLRVTVHQVP